MYIYIYVCVYACVCMNIFIYIYIHVRVHSTLQLWLGASIDVAVGHDGHRYGLSVGADEWCELTEQRTKRKGHEQCHIMSHGNRQSAIYIYICDISCLAYYIIYFMYKMTYVDKNVLSRVVFSNYVALAIAPFSG